MVWSLCGLSLVSPVRQRTHIGSQVNHCWQPVLQPGRHRRKGSAPFDTWVPGSPVTWFLLRLGIICFLLSTSSSCLHSHCCRWACTHLCLCSPRQPTRQLPQTELSIRLPFLGTARADRCPAVLVEFGPKPYLGRVDGYHYL